MIALIDCDLVCYRVAAACQEETLEQALKQADLLINRLCDETQADSYKLFLTGSDNFRYKYNPEYKANRKDVPKPPYLEPLREHLIVNYGAVLSSGCEADDLLGITQTECHKQDMASVIVSLDKDLLMIEGNHYSWEISGPLKDGNRWTKAAVRHYTTPVQGLRHFYGQLLLGDKSDNIFGFDGLARVKVPQKMQWMFDRLEELDDEDEMYDFIMEQYQDFNGMAAEQRVLMNGKCLWIQTKENEEWFPPWMHRETHLEAQMKEESIVMVNGQKVDSMPS